MKGKLLVVIIIFLLYIFVMTKLFQQQFIYDVLNKKLKTRTSQKQLVDGITENKQVGEKTIQGNYHLNRKNINKNETSTATDSYLVTVKTKIRGIRVDDNDVPGRSNGIKYLNNNDESEKINVYDNIQNLFRDPFSQKDQKPVHFLPEYKSPCFMHQDKVKCIPAFYVIGIPKCGTTDLYKRMTKHRLILEGKQKENYWLSRNCGNAYADLSGYLSYYEIASRTAQDIIEMKNGTTYHPIAIGDFTPTTIHIMHYWSEGIKTPMCIRRIVPQAKLVISLRNPVARVLSGYKFTIRTPFTDDKFHQDAKESIEWMKSCIKTKSAEECLFSRDAQNLVASRGSNTLRIMKVEIMVSLYYYSVLEWFNNYPRENILISRFEDYISNPDEHLRQVIYPYLDIEYEHGNTVQAAPKPNTEKDMLEKTRVMLEDFYRPYNDKLAKFLNDERFRWL